jgi:hypothetical protein
MPKTRLELMVAILHLNNLFIDTWNQCRKSNMKKNPLLQPNWLNEEFNRFYLVESTTHVEDEFTVNIELRYALRSKEIREMGSHDRFLKTISFSLDEINNPEVYISEMIAELSELKEK